jgi:hypothetical protein
MEVFKLFNSQFDQSNEAKCAQVLADLIQYSIEKNTDGSVYILPNMKCPQAKNKDLDLVVWFNMKEGFSVDVKSGVKGNSVPIKRTIKVKDALLIFEVKGHNEYSGIRIENQKLYCKYEGIFHDVTGQSEGQKTALINFLDNQISKAPFVVNLIWMHRADSSNYYDNHQVSNIVWGRTSISQIFETVFRNNLPVKNGSTEYYRSSISDEIAEKTTEYFEVLRKNSAVGIGKISRKKVNDLIQKDITLFEKSYFNEIGSKLTLIHGNPGTGKTIHLISLAKNLLQKRDLKSLILTFNKALQQDIKRLLMFSGLPDLENINIQTFDSFVYRCLDNFGEKPSDNKFQEWTEKLYELVKDEINPRDSFPTATQFDCVLIDEGQDWCDEKKAIIFKLFGYKYSVVAIGENQLVENRFHQNWGVGLNREQKQKFTLEISHRNKINIVEFLALIGKGYDWNLITNRKLIGGRTVIATSYTYDLHKELVSDLQNNENSFYDMMFLASTNESMSRIESLINSFGQKAFVANKEENRNQMFPLDQFRVISYQACRGLEAWTVVCFEWDVFIEEILGNSEITSIQQAIESFNLIVMTRAIDTLVITIKNPESSISKSLIEIANLNPSICRLFL